ncbi:hypothetical protein J4450_03950 [Candidatus Micrarchaeota archaeon]|nr:hypothetical protein [Candidatus Micrarchaeota archaeon]
MATLRNYILPLERDALRKRAQMRSAASSFSAAATSGGQDTMKWFGVAQKGGNGNGKPYGPQPAPKPVSQPKQHTKRFEVVGGWPGVKGKVYLD